MSKEELLKIAKPILFNTEMVKAILEGRKTVTRRVINWDIVNRCDMERDGTLLCFEDEYGDHIRPEKLCRYKPGDILYVRETWNHYNHNIIAGPQKGYHEGYFYKASPEMKSTLPVYVQYHWGKKWKPSIHMPKEAARIFLQVKDVRVERLQEIDDKGAYMEGAGEPNTVYQLGARVCEFAKIWQSTIKKGDIDTYGWDASPYVWVIEFERIEVE